MADDEIVADALPTSGGGFDWADDVAAEHAASSHDAAAETIAVRGGRTRRASAASGLPRLTRATHRHS